MAARLPEVFVHNPYPDAVNNVLWTLYFEAACYLGLFVSGIAGCLSAKRLPLLLLAYASVYLLARYGPWTKLNYWAVFSLPFVIGMVVYRYGPGQVLKGWIAVMLAVAAFVTAHSGHGVEELWSLAVAYGILWLGFAPAPPLLAYNRLGDFSYGTYIYGFPIQQIFSALLPGVGPAALIGLTLPTALVCGVLSWHFVERPALRLRFTHG
jgi:peptidoglycan/LPS O-acetylase OafA/YrhL